MEKTKDTRAGPATETVQQVEQPCAGRRAARKPALRLLLRTALIFAIALCLGWGANRLARLLYEPGPPAGFAHGLVHGATMPLAMPNLLVGMDLDIYAPHNTGRTYKLGYTFGVNLCGIIFFGVLFRRLRRWRRKGRSAVSTAE